MSYRTIFEGLDLSDASTTPKVVESLLFDTWYPFVYELEYSDDSNIGVANVDATRNLGESWYQVYFGAGESFSSKTLKVDDFTNGFRFTYAIAESGDPATGIVTLRVAGRIVA
jgi:hypothetical protein